MNKRNLLVSVLVLSALLVFSLGFAAATSPCDPNPTLLFGNPKNMFPEMNSYKFDDSENDFGKTVRHELPDSEYYIEVTYTADGLWLDWESNLPIKYVIVKGGPNAYLYCINENGEPNENLRAPDNRGGYQSQISHVTFYWGEVANGADPFGALTVVKFYDANVNGEFDLDEEELAGWLVKIEIDDEVYFKHTPVTMNIAPGTTVTVTECDSIVGNWVATTETSVEVEIRQGFTEAAEFGNVCLGGGGGQTIGFWTNRNGERAMTTNGMSTLLAGLRDLNLKNAAGSDFNPNHYAEFRNWLRGANAVNMKYMLSAQLAGMYLNVRTGFVDGNAFVYAPGVDDEKDFVPISALIAKTNAALNDSNDRDYLETLKDALDAANNNKNFVQSGPCDFRFDCPVEN